MHVCRRSGEEYLNRRPALERQRVVNSYQLGGCEDRAISRVAWGVKTDSPIKGKGAEEKRRLLFNKLFVQLCMAVFQNCLFNISKNMCRVNRKEMCIRDRVN